MKILQSKNSIVKSVNPVVLLLTEESIQKHTIYKALVKAVPDSFKAKEKQFYVAETDQPPKFVVLLGLGKTSDIIIEKIRKAGASAVNVEKSIGFVKFSVYVESINSLPEHDVSKALSEGIVLGNYKFDKYKTKEKDSGEKIIEQVELYTLADFKPVIEAARVCDIVNESRDTANEGADIMTPIEIAAIAKSIAGKYSSVTCTILDKKQMEKMSMNLILGVSRGSEYDPVLVILEYKGAGNEKPVALVGKGVTFDSGGLNLKPSGYIENMHTDKSGAITVLYTIKAAADIGLKCNIIGVLPCCENMIGSKAQKPGSIIKSYSGKTVEIGNTDAEGRLILADAFSYTVDKLKPETIIDIATLTGSCMVTFGEHVAGMISTDEKLAKDIFDAGQKTYERVWQLPLYKEYEEEMESEKADIKNIGSKDRYAGTITAAAFLKAFTKDKPWAHLDIAGTATTDKQKSYISAGATGFGIRLFIEFLKAREKKK